MKGLELADSLEQLWNIGEKEEEKPKVINIFPAGNLWDIGKAVAGSDIPSDVLDTVGEYTPEVVKQGGAIVGNKLCNACVGNEWCSIT